MEKLSYLEIPLDKELTATLSRCNPYETRGADPGCEGICGMSRVCALEAAKSLKCC